MNEPSGNVFTALSDPNRRRIVELLTAGEMSSSEIAGQFRISAPAVSQHLKVLRAARLVRVRVDAQKRWYAPDPRGLAELEGWLNHVRGFWNAGLDRLQAELELARSDRSKRYDPEPRRSHPPAPSDLEQPP